MSEQKRYALITGCSNDTGIGVKLAKRLLDDGYEVFVTARSIERLGGAKSLGCIVRRAIPKTR